MFTIKVTNIKDGSIQSSDFGTKEECELWIKECEKNESWGKLQHTIHVGEVIHRAPIGLDGKPIGSDEIIAAHDEVIPTEYTVEIIEAKSLLSDISARQLEMALLAFNIDGDMVEEAIRKLPEIKDQKLALIAWRRSGKFVRSEPSVSLIGKLLGLDDEKLDSIWINGFKL